MTRAACGIAVDALLVLVWGHFWRQLVNRRDAQHGLLWHRLLFGLICLFEIITGFFGLLLWYLEPLLWYLELLLWYRHLEVGVGIEVGIEVGVGVRVGDGVR